jgi:hypothetical protein
MSHNVITSFNEKYYETKGGKEFVETFKKHWPKSVKLTIYFEGDELLPDEDNVSWRYIEEVEGYMEWMEAISKFPVMSGNVGRYNIEYDARMCRAAFIHAHALKTLGGKVFWIDADVVTHSDVPETFLDEVLPDNKFCCCLSRPWFNTETGFLGINANHPLIDRWLDAWIQVYVSGLIFTMPGWHDNWGFDLARKAVKFDSEFVNLAEGLPHGTQHVFINSRLGAFCDHLKGNRKNKTSRRDDLVVERTEPYWTGITEKVA